MEVVSVASPTGPVMDIPLNGRPCTPELIHSELPKIRYPVLFFDGKPIPRDSTIPAAPDLSIAVLSRSQFPEKAFPQADYSFYLDNWRFSCHPPTEDFPDPTNRGKSKDVHDEVLREMMEDMSRHVAGPHAYSLDEYDPGLSSDDRMALKRKRRKICMTEEEDGENAIDDSDNDEEEDVATNLSSDVEIVDDLWPNQEDMMKRLSGLGFDRSFVWQLLTITHGDEAGIRAILSGFEGLVRGVPSMD
jgi:hypothetical protein